MSHLAARRRATKPMMDPVHAIDLAAEELEHINRHYSAHPEEPISRTCFHGLATVQRLLDDPHVQQVLADLPSDRHRRFALAVAATGNRPDSYLHAGFKEPTNREEFLRKLEEISIDPLVVIAVGTIAEAWNRRWSQSADTIADSVQLALDLALGRRPSKRTVVTKGEVTVVDDYFQSDPRSVAKLAEIQLRLLGLQEEATRTAANAVSWEVPRTQQAAIDHDVHDAQSVVDSMDAAAERAKAAKNTNKKAGDGIVDLAKLRGQDLED
jgi:hypothetical protein